MSTTGKVSFRIGKPYSRLLDESASQRGLSAHQYARLILVNHFERQSELDLRDDLRSLEAEVRALREDFNAAVE